MPERPGHSIIPEFNDSELVGWEDVVRVAEKAAVLYDEVFGDSE